MNPRKSRNNARVLATIAGAGLALLLQSAAAIPKADEPAAISIPAPTGDNGVVVFFREKKFAGAMVGFMVRENDKELGKLSNGSYFTVELPAGPHAFVVHSESKDVVNIEVERGETYYIAGSISMGVMVGRPNLSPSSAEAFDKAKAKLKNSAAAKTAE